MERLKKLLNGADNYKGKPWVIGRIPEHYKKVSVSKEKMIELALYGQEQVFANFGNTLYFSQAVIAGAILSDEFDRYAIVTPSQFGKAIEDHTPVLTRDGWKEHGQLKVGDEVIGLHGEFVKVTYVHPKCEMDRVVTFSNGESIICHHNHEWVFKWTNGRKKIKCIRQISVAEMEKRGIHLPDGHSKFLTPLREPVIGEHKDFAVEPYVMGVWLGDGSTTKGQICAHPKDIAVLDKCRQYYPEGSEWAHKDTGVITRSFIGLANDLSTYNMCFQRKDTPRKHIPQEYLTADIGQRLELLAGLIDTDGYEYPKDGRYYFTTADEPLKDSFEQLIATFGWRTSTVRMEPFKSSSGIVGKHPYWVIGFNPTLEIPCVLERKRNTRLSKQRCISVERIEETQSHRGNCITVEGGIYRVGKTLLPTHNSWTLGRVALINASKGRGAYIAGANEDVTRIIMEKVIGSLKDASEDLKEELLTDGLDRLEKLGVSLSKKNLALKNGGFVSPITLGASFGGLAYNKAVGRSADFYVDEAALVPTESFTELGRTEFSHVDGEKDKMIMISNPHQPGYFYDALTEANPDERTFILWMDARTAVEEGRWTSKQVMESEFAKHNDTRVRYLLCELPQTGIGMFGECKTSYEPTGNRLHFLGVDAAYKGKDKIQLCHVSTGRGGLYVHEITEIEKKNWIDGVTSSEIINLVLRVYKATGAMMICADIGFGVWLVEGLAKAGVNVQGINFASRPTPERVKANHYAAVEAKNVRAEMHLDLQDLIEKHAIKWDDNSYEKVKETLPYISSERTANGKILIRPKDEIKGIIGKSPDELDSVLLAIHAAILYTGETSEYMT